MVRVGQTDGLDMVQRYRAARRVSGMKLLRMWVPDPDAPGFLEKATAKPLCCAVLQRRLSLGPGSLRRGDLATVAFSGDYGKPRPALVIQSDLLGDTAAPP